MNVPQELYEPSFDQIGDWSPVFDFSFGPQNPRNERYLGTDTPRRCRFCKEDAQTLSFHNDSHIIPEALGNRDLLSLEECDDCNRKGSLLETDLASYWALTRALSRIRGKQGGDVKYRHHGKAPSYIEGHAGAKGLPAILRRAS